MSCSLNSGQQLGCRESIAGIRTIYLANFENVIQSGITTNASSQITGITMSSSTKFYQFDLRRETAQYSEAIQSNIQNGTLYYEGTLAMFLDKAQTTTRNQIQLLAKAKLMCIFLDKNNQYWLQGQVNGADLTSGTVDWGKASGDANGYTLNFISQEINSAPEVLSSVIAGIVSY